MLQVFHSFKKSHAILLLVIVVAFVMTSFGVGMGGPKQQNAALTVDGEEVPYTEFYRQRQDLEHRYRQVFGANLDQFLPNLRLNQQVVDGLISEKLMAKLADQVGLVYSKSGVEKMILSSGLFPNGYDEQVYRAFLQQSGMTSAQFETELQSKSVNQQISKLIEDVSFASLKETEAEIRQTETSYDVNYVEFSPEFLLTSVKQPSEDQLKEFYESNSTDYETQPAISYHYIKFDPKESISDVEILPEDIEIYYSEHENEFKLPEEVHLRHIQLNFSKDDTPEKMSKLKERAEELRKKVMAGQPFEELAQIHSDDFATKTLGGDLGFVSKTNTSVPKEVLGAAFAKKTPGILELISTEYGYSIVKLEEYKEGSLKDLSLVKADIEKNLREEQAPAYASSKAHDIYEEWIKAKLSLDQFALKKDMIAAITPSLMERMQDPESLKGLTAKIMDNPELKEQIVELGDVTVLAGIKEFQPSEVPALINVKPQLLKAWNEKESNRLAKEAADSFVMAMTDASYKTLAEGTTKLKLKLLSAKDISQAKPGAAPFSDPAIQKDLFSTVVAKAAPKQSYRVGNKYYVYEVSTLKFPDPKEIEKKVSAAREQESRKVSSLLMASLVSSLKAKADITVSNNLELDS